MPVQVAGQKDWPVDGVEENKEDRQQYLAHQLKLKITTLRTAIEYISLEAQHIDEENDT